MGLRGAAPQPSKKGSRITHRTKSPDARLVGLPEAPAAPAGVLAVTRDWWDTFWASSLARFLKPTDVHSLIQLALMYDERERAQRIIRKTRLEELETPDGRLITMRVSNRLVTGSKGQPVLNPLIRYVEDLQSDIVRLEDRFGLTPKARLSLGLKLEEGMRRLESLTGTDDDDQDEDQTDQAQVIEFGADAAPGAGGGLSAPPG